MPKITIKQTKETEHRDCCYYQCLEPGAIHIGKSGGDSHWICFFHYTKWNADRARFLADGIGCEMEELPMTANKENPETQLPFWTGRAQSHPGLDHPSDSSRMVYVEEIRIVATTQIAGSEAPTRDDVVKRYLKSVREQFPGRALYRVRPIPEGEPPAYIFMVALVCYQPTSDWTADLFELVLCWSADDFDFSLADKIEREVSDIEWEWVARQTVPSDSSRNKGAAG